MKSGTALGWRGWALGATIFALAGCSTATETGLLFRQVQSITVTGSSVAGAADGAANVATFNNPVNVAVDPAGNTYVADFDNGRIRKIDTSGNVSTLVNQANFARPFGIAFQAPDKLFVQTDANDLGQRDSTTGTLWSVNLAAGGATVIARNLGRPRGLLILPDGRVVLSDIAHHTLRLLDPTSGAITLLAGANDSPGLVNDTGAAARFNRPYGVARDINGDILVADANNHCIRRVTLAGVTTTLAGRGTAGYLDDVARFAIFNTPQDVAVDSAGVCYVADTQNHRIRKIDRAGNVSTIAGDGTAGFRDGMGLLAQFFGLEGMDLTPDGSALIVADGTGGENVPFNRVRRVTVP